MKVIEQLISYFSERGELTPRQLQQLTLKGYWAQHDPSELRSLTDRVGETFFFKVTGDPHAGSVWGTDVYTSDSHLPTACVHAGVLKAGESGVVKVLIVDPPGSFSSSTRNGVTSSSYGTWGGAYRVEAID